MRKAATLLVYEVEKKQARRAFGEAGARGSPGKVWWMGSTPISPQPVRAASRGIGVPAIGSPWTTSGGFKEVELRAANDELAQREAVAATAREQLTHASRESRVVEAALEGYDERVAVERRRAEGRKLDATATQRWWRENS